jgi:hypothetical protein
MAVKGCTDTDKGFKQIGEEIKALKDLSVKVGVVEGAGTNPDGVFIAQYAAWNEMGVKGKGGKYRIPPRPFIRGWIDNSRSEIQQTVEKLFSQVVSGNMSARDAMERLGQFGQDGIRGYIKNGNFTPNSPVTIALKKSSQPLIDTGALRNSIRYKVLGRGEKPANK